MGEYDSHHLPMAHYGVLAALAEGLEPSILDAPSLPQARARVGRCDARRRKETARSKGGRLKSSDRLKGMEQGRRLARIAKLLRIGSDACAAPIQNHHDRALHRRVIAGFPSRA